MISHGIEYHLYADDNQLYIIFKPAKSAEAVSKMESCVRDIKMWMVRNKLMFNDDKTEGILIGTPQQLKKVNIPSVKIGDCNIQPTNAARNLGVIFDTHLSMKPHVQTVAKNAWFHLRNLFQIHKCLSPEAAEILVHAFVTSRLDNSNSLLFGLPKSTLRPLQLVQNAAARLVARKKIREHITPVMISLHWLPLPYRIQYKILITAFKAIHSMAPKYICELVTVQQNTRALRSSKELRLSVPRTKNVTCGDASFRGGAPQLWNSLPVDIRNIVDFNDFKKQLKTILFTRAYGNV